MKSNQSRIGKRKGKIKAIGIPKEYLKLAQEDKLAATKLMNFGIYRPAAYLIIQAIEKLLKYKIFTRVNAGGEFFREINRTHDITASIDFLMNVINYDELTKKAIRTQLEENVLKGKMLKYLNSSLRYPQYSKKFDSFSILEVSRRDVEHLLKILDTLEKYLEKF